MDIDEEITLKKLEVFLVFMRVSNMARVAEFLGQSTVSVHRALHSLEEGVGCPLFKREGRSLIPLPTAYVFSEYVKRAIGECEEGLRIIRAKNGVDSTQLKIGSLYSLTLHCIPQLIIKLKLRRPDLDIHLTLGSNRELLASLMEGQLDGVVISLDRDDEYPGLVAIPLFEDQIFLAAAIGSAFADKKNIDLRDLRTEKFVSLHPGFATTQNFDLAFERAGFRPHIAMHVSEIFSLINLVCAGIGYSLLPGRVSAFSSRIQLISIDSKYASCQKICLLLPKSRERDANLLALAAECRMYRRRENS